ncbi:hypothetical protein KIF59_13485 [Enterobacter cloacae subsp. cloacae]|nr:hypothetical protein [Enterobacter cloacae subsp. cloacae]
MFRRCRNKVYNINQSKVSRMLTNLAQCVPVRQMGDGLFACQLNLVCRQPLAR